MHIETNASSTIFIQNAIMDINAIMDTLNHVNSIMDIHNGC